MDIEKVSLAPQNFTLYKIILDHTTLKTKSTIISHVIRNGMLVIRSIFMV